MTQQGLTRRQNQEQQRGKQAWDDIRKIKDLKNEDLEKKYRSLARGLNAMIQINGLGQALGFLKAKSKVKTGKDQEKTPDNEHAYLLSHLTAWMRAHFVAENSSTMNDQFDGLLIWVVDKDTSSMDYRLATTECLAFGIWLRRFAEAELKEPDTGDDQ